MAISIPFGGTAIDLDISPGRLVAIHRVCEPTAASDVAALFHSAVDSPARFPALRLALTPDDHVAIVVDDWQTTKLAIPSILEQLHQAGVRDENVAVVGPYGKTPPEDFVGLRTEEHDPADPQRKCYVAITKDGHRIYLNRTVVEADQLVVVAQTRYEAGGRSTGGPMAIFPAMADQESRDAWRNLSASELRAKAIEISRLVGTVFFVHAIAGEGDSIHAVIGGDANSFLEARKCLQSTWELKVDRPADTVIATVGGNSDQSSIADVVAALANATRAVVPGGTIVLCVAAALELPDEFEIIRNSDSPEVASKKLKRSESNDAAYANRWLKAVESHRVAVLGGWPEEVVEDLFATALTQPNQVQRIVDRGGDVTLLPDAHRVRVVVESKKVE